MPKILYIQASGRQDKALSRHLADGLIARLREAHKGATISIRDISQDMTFPTEASVGAGYTPADQRTPQQNRLLAFSDILTDELLASDILVIATPMYNFGPPAALKAWMDMVVRVGKTFRFGEDGAYVPLAGDRKTYVVVTAGGVPMGCPVDFLTPWLTTVLGFMGITSVEYIYTAGTNKPEGPEAIEETRQKIAALAV